MSNLLLLHTFHKDALFINRHKTLLIDSRYALPYFLYKLKTKYMT